ncbi:hypothetical protein [Streptomonospora litoralis]|uniref:Uncharacterized protein n=1 Tax=Streptomonospora litoralis TaxID=2498135 RepID=A0A4P6Q3A6_9ACTN|nr:hypothetical protein [Streptomonospora litoralis]QBI54660.1 hypothetical protein EKD16_14395 [Streptomonospora litoralis]
MRDAADGDSTDDEQGAGAGHRGNDAATPGGPPSGGSDASAGAWSSAEAAREEDAEEDIWVPDEDFDGVDPCAGS